MSLKPWRNVIHPHQDVREGKFQESEFAADLTKVVQNKATPEYQDPVTFFERTVITEGMSLLLQSVVKRLSGHGGDPVVQLQTAFGGGKTHTLMAVLHVATADVPPRQLQGVPEVLRKVGASELPRGRVAVLDGNALSPSQPRSDGGVTRNTLWGELAFQLAGKEGYELVRGADEDGTSPGKAVLATLFERCAPSVVLLDETVAYLRQLEANKSYKGGTFNSNLSFLQALTEAASATPRAMVLASLPESKLEVGDSHGQAALEAVQKYFGRIEAIWKPVATHEAFEIVRRRLFGPVDDEGAMEATCRAFFDLYQANKEHYPSDAREGAYLDRLRASYPIHPEVFDRLYEDWSTLPRFQRTRGVLRLMARVINVLWRQNNQDYLIMPGSLPLYDAGAAGELTKYLPTGWEPILDKDIDGDGSTPARLDDATPTLGSVQACRRAARTIFLGSAPSVSAQKVRGIETERVRLGCVQPGEPVGRYDDALRYLSDNLHYLYTGHDRYWYDLRPNLRREMETRRSRFQDVTDVVPEVKRRLERLVRRGLFQAVHVFAKAQDIPDKPDLRLVVLEPGRGHKRRDEGSAAIQAAAELLKSHGEKGREYANRIVFLAAGQERHGTLMGQVRAFLAWDSICKDADELNLDKHHEKEAKQNRSDADVRVDATLKEAYKHLLVPAQDAPQRGEAMPPVYFEEALLQAAAHGFDEAIERSLLEHEHVIRAWSPVHLKNVLARWYWKDGKSTVGLARLWDDFCRYPYLPRLLSSDVLLDTVRVGVADRDGFGYAHAAQDDGHYQGLVFGASAGAVYLDELAVLIESSAAEAALLAQSPPLDPPPPQTPDEGADAKRTSSSSTGDLGRTAAGRDASITTLVRHRRFHASVSVNVDDPIQHFSNIVKEVIEQFSAQFGTSVAITVDVEAKRAEGFDANLQRAVKENCATLKFSHAEFEEE